MFSFCFRYTRFTSQIRASGAIPRVFAEFTWWGKRECFMLLASELSDWFITSETFLELGDRFIF